MSKMDLETPSVDTIRTLWMDALQAADSGHPGTLLAHDTRRTVAAAKALHAEADGRNLYVADRRNLCIADRRNLFIKVTLPFSAYHHRAVADAHLRGIERRVQAGHDPALAVGLDVYRAYREVMGSQCFQRLENAGARMRRLLRAGTRTKDPACSPRTGSARWSRSTSTACSPGGRSEGSTPSTSGASSSARCLLSRSARSSRA
ncbi:hypothetical protein [Streptomyces sp. NBC_00271]|uniref:hypothetical protein n=1 Tax=Streptomyces sp. NBC_00271 TaxID=2975697 RepID=UPI002E2E0A80|nr:hypothetical protein [Streptomyces sp. NBC_00271]